MTIKTGKGYKSVEDLLRNEYPDHPEYVDGYLREAGRDTDNKNDSPDKPSLMVEIRPDVKPALT